MAELIVKYRLDADGLYVKDLIAQRDFLAQRLGIPEHLLQVLSWGNGSIMITYWVVQDILPLAELALCREDIQAELTQHGVEVVYLDSHPSEHRDPAVSFRGMVHDLCSVVCMLWCFSLLHCRWTSLCRLCTVRDTGLLSCDCVLVCRLCPAHCLVHVSMPTTVNYQCVFPYSAKTCYCHCP